MARVAAICYGDVRCRERSVRPWPSVDVVAAAWLRARVRTDKTDRTWFGGRARLCSVSFVSGFGAVVDERVGDPGLGSRSRAAGFDCRRPDVAMRLEEAEGGTDVLDRAGAAVDGAVRIAGGEPGRALSFDPV